MKIRGNLWAIFSPHVRVGSSGRPLDLLKQAKKVVIKNDDSVIRNDDIVNQNDDKKCAGIISFHFSRNTYIETAIFSLTNSPIISAGVLFVAWAFVISHFAERSSTVIEQAVLRTLVKNIPAFHRMEYIDRFFINHIIKDFQGITTIIFTMQP